MNRVIGAFSLATICLSVNSAEAQHVFYATANLGNGSHALARAPLTGEGLGPFELLQIMPGAGGDVVATIDGRFVAWQAGTQVAALDTRTATVITLPIDLTTSNTGRLSHLFADASKHRVYAVTSGPEASMTIIEATGLRSMPIGEVEGFPASNGRDLFVVRTVRNSTSFFYRVAAIDMESGSEVYQLPLDFYPLPQLSLSDDSRRLAVADNDYDNPILKIFDTDTRVEQASRRLPPLTSFGSMYQPLEFDEERNRLFVGYHERRGVLGSELSGRLLVLDAGTLGDLGAVDGGAPKFALARRNELGVNAPFFSGRGGCVTIAVEVWGADNSPLRVSSGIRCLSGSTIVSVPDAMSTVAHHVTDRRVTLSWPTVLGASDYVVEAGSLPGLSNLARVQSGGANQFVANGVPPGTYYVRVRGLNEVGSGTPSPELIVTVR